MTRKQSEIRNSLFILQHRMLRDSCWTIQDVSYTIAYRTLWCTRREGTHPYGRPATCSKSVSCPFFAYAPPWVMTEVFLSVQRQIVSPAENTEAEVMCSASKTITGGRSVPILSGATDFLEYRNDEAQQLRFACRVHTTSGGERQYKFESCVVRTVPALQEAFRAKTIQEQWKWKVPVPYRCDTGGWCAPINSITIGGTMFPFESTKWKRGGTLEKFQPIYGAQKKQQQVVSSSCSAELDPLGNM